MHLADEVQLLSEQVDHLASEHVRIARDMHEHGFESDEALAHAEDIAGRVLENTHHLRQITQRVKRQRKATPAPPLRHE